MDSNKDGIGKSVNAVRDVFVTF